MPAAHWVWRCCIYGNRANNRSLDVCYFPFAVVVYILYSLNTLHLVCIPNSHVGKQFFSTISKLWSVLETHDHSRTLNTSFLFFLFFFFCSARSRSNRLRIGSETREGGRAQGRSSRLPVPRPVFFHLRRARARSVFAMPRRRRRRRLRRHSGCKKSARHGMQPHRRSPARCRGSRKNQRGGNC